MSLFTFGDFEIEIDPTNVEFVEKYEAAAEEYNTKIKAVPTDGKASETLRAICGVFCETFDRLFGKGTSKKMFANVQSIDLCVKAFKQLIDMMNDYSKTLEMLPSTAKKNLSPVKKCKK